MSKNTEQTIEQKLRNDLIKSLRTGKQDKIKEFQTIQEHTGYTPTEKDEKQASKAQLLLVDFTTNAKGNTCDFSTNSIKQLTNYLNNTKDQKIREIFTALSSIPQNGPTHLKPTDFQHSVKEKLAMLKAEYDSIHGNHLTPFGQQYLKSQNFNGDDFVNKIKNLDPSNERGVG
jgi:hypothetical protein